MNAYYLRVALLGLVAGRIGHDFTGQLRELSEFSGDFEEEVAVPERPGDWGHPGLKPLECGIIVDHIAVCDKPKLIWEVVASIRKVCPPPGSALFLRRTA